MPRVVSASFYAAIATLDDEAEEVERANVTRSEALAMADRFWSDVEKWRARGGEAYNDSTLSFTRGDDEVIEFSMWSPDAFDVRYGCTETWKLFGFIPMHSRHEHHLMLTKREEVVEFVEAFLATADPGKFREWVLRRRPTRFRTDWPK